MKPANKFKELVVILPGNSYICYVADTEVDSVDAKITEAVDNRRAWLSLSDSSRRAKIHVPSICGFYFRNHQETPTEKLIKKQTEMVETVTGIMKKENESESWKNEG